jgi:phosphonate transport system substrate-binding protein
MKLILPWRSDRVLPRSLAFVLLFCLSTIVVSCTASSNPSKPEATSAPPAVSQPLQVAVIPWQSSEEQYKKLQPLVDYLQQTLKRPVSFQITKDYESAVELLAQEKVEIAYLAALTYVKAHEKNPSLAPIVVPIDQLTGRPWYTSVIVADTNKSIHSLQDLKGKRFAFVSPSSTSGFLMPMTAFQKEGIDPTRDFTEIRYSGSHNKAETDLIEGRVDAIAHDKASFLRSQKSGRLSSAYKIIWESDPLPTGPIVINLKKFSPEAIARLQQALIDAPIGVVDVAGTQSAGYTLAKDADFEAVRQIYTRLKSLSVPAK